MNGPRQMIILGKVRQRKTNIIWYHLYEQSLRNETNELQNKNRFTETVNKRMVTKGEMGGRDKLGGWD